MALGLVVFLWVMEEWVGSMEMRIGQWRLPENLGGEDHEFSERLMKMYEGWFLSRDKGEVVTEARLLWDECVGRWR
ncbi:hypothetical protein V6N12_064355 [Hibiscus sabdariffa]|uniref:Uncharacterized protein n=1 Tax=Hibiscus sabdariffa TaxID=183260 RepID=A0ABR2G5K6_9ROSI